MKTFLQLVLLSVSGLTVAHAQDYVVVKDSLHGTEIKVKAAGFPEHLVAFENTAFQRGILTAEIEAGSKLEIGRSGELRKIYRIASGSVRYGDGVFALRNQPRDNPAVELDDRGPAEVTLDQDSRIFLDELNAAFTCQAGRSVYFSGNRFLSCSMNGTETVQLPGGAAAVKYVYWESPYVSLELEGQSLLKPSGCSTAVAMRNDLVLDSALQILVGNRVTPAEISINGIRARGYHFTNVRDCSAVFELDSDIQMLSEQGHEILFESTASLEAVAQSKCRELGFEQGTPAISIDNYTAPTVFYSRSQNQLVEKPAGRYMTARASCSVTRRLPF